MKLNTKNSILPAVKFAALASAIFCLVSSSIPAISGTPSMVLIMSGFDFAAITTAPRITIKLKMPKVVPCKIAANSTLRTKTGILFNFQSFFLTYKRYKWLIPTPKKAKITFEISATPKGKNIAMAINEVNMRPVHPPNCKSQ